MLNLDLHRLLKRQLQKSQLDASELKKLESFLSMVNDAYTSFDKDLLHIENILEESSKELFKVHQSLKQKHESAKSRLKNIVNNVQGVLFQTDINGNFTYLNRAWVDLTGLSIKKSLNKNYKELFTDLNRQEKIRIQRLLADKKDQFKTIFKYYKPNKEYKWIKLYLSQTFNQDGQPNGSIGTMTDVTSLKETEIKLNKANKTKDEFLSTMSHEMRTPLNAVIGLSNILLSERYLPDQLENLQVLKHSGEHLLDLINNILDLNKINSGNVNYVESTFSLDHLLEELQGHFSYETKSKKVKFKIVKDKNIPNWLLGDRLMLLGVLKNLLSNAFKFTESGKISLTTELSARLNEDVKILFKVKDTGIGIAFEKQEDIFESFVQAETNTSRLYGGTGLGLSISKKILNIQNSELNLESEPGEGATFWFTLNFKTSNRQSNNTTTTKSDFIISNAPINLNVLVAEDNKLNQLVLKKLFDKWKINFKIADNGKLLLKEYKKQHYDLILMDLQMPVLDGYETTEIIRNLPDKIKSSIPIIALTAFSHKEEKEKSKKYKMDGFMTKPIIQSEFYEILSFYGEKIKNTG